MAERNPIETDIESDVAEAAFTEVLVEARPAFRRVGRPSELATVSLKVARVVVDKNIKPAVIVEIPKPAREAFIRLGETMLWGQILEGSVAAIVVKTVAAPEIRDIEVDEAVAVVIAPGGSLGEAVIAHAGGFRDVDKRSIASIAIKPAAVPRVGNR